MRNQSPFGLSWSRMNRQSWQTIQFSVASPMPGVLSGWDLKKYSQPWISFSSRTHTQCHKQFNHRYTVPQNKPPQWSDLKWLRFTRRLPRKQSPESLFAFEFDLSVMKPRVLVDCFPITYPQIHWWLILSYRNLSLHKWLLTDRALRWLLSDR